MSNTSKIQLSDIDFVSLRRLLTNRYGDVGAWREDVRRLMREHKITQTMLATRAGYPDPTTISKWLRGRVRPTLESRLIVDEALRELIEG